MSNLCTEFTLSQNFHYVSFALCCLALFLSFLTLICVKWVPEDPSTTFLVTSSTRKMPECSDSMNSSIFMPENI